MLAHVATGGTKSPGEQVVGVVFSFKKNKTFMEPIFHWTFFRRCFILYCKATMPTNSRTMNGMNAIENAALFSGKVVLKL